MASPAPAVLPNTFRSRHTRFCHTSLVCLSVLFGSHAMAGSLSFDQSFRQQVFQESWQDYRLDSQSSKLRYADDLWQDWRWSASLSSGYGSNSTSRYKSLGWGGSVSWSGSERWFSLSYGNHRNQLNIDDDNGTAAASVSQYHSRSHFHSQSLAIEAGQDFWLGDAWLVSGWLNATQSSATSDYYSSSTTDGSDSNSSDSNDDSNSGRDNDNSVDDGSTDNSNTSTTTTDESNSQSGTDLGAGISVAWLTEDSRGWLWSPGASLDYQKTVIGELLTASNDDYQSSEQQNSSTLAHSWSAASVFLNVFDERWNASLSYSCDLGDSNYSSWTLGAGWSW